MPDLFYGNSFLFKGTRYKRQGTSIEQRLNGLSPHADVRDPSFPGMISIISFTTSDSKIHFARIKNRNPFALNDPQQSNHPAIKQYSYCITILYLFACVLIVFSTADSSVGSLLFAADFAFSSMMYLLRFALIVSISFCIASRSFDFSNI